MANIILFLVSFPSAIAYFLLFASASKTSLIFAFSIGIVVGVINFLYFKKTKANLNKIYSPFALLFGIVLCFFCVKYFYNTWISSLNTINGVISKWFSDHTNSLLVISILWGLMALPFCSWLMGLFINIIRLIDFKELWMSLTLKSTKWARVKSICIVIINLILSVFIGALFLIGAYKLPVNTIDDNVKASAKIIDTEGRYPRLTGWCTSQLDNFTDSIMLLESANYKVSSPIEDAMNVPRGYIENLFPDAALTAHYVQGTKYDKVANYPRYWHGYLIILKPLLLFFDYGGIRIINGVVQILLIVAISYTLYRNNLKAAIIPYILAYCMLMPVALAKTFQFSSCFYIMTLGSIFLLLLPSGKIKEKSYLIFLYCGILTAYFDLLTYPIATFGVPMIFLLLLAHSESTEEKIGSIIRKGATWCVGFGCMWVAKWVIGSIITGKNVIIDGIERVAERTANISVDGTEQFNILQCEIKNFKAFFKTPVTIFIIVYIAYLIYRCHIKSEFFIKNIVRILLPFAIVGFVPVLWYAFALNHSAVHYWFTNKASVTFLLAILLGLVSLSQHKEFPEDRP